MSHATPGEIHDHVYGFRACPHLRDCPECRRAAEAVEAEREALKGALAEEPREAPPGLAERLAARRPGRPAPAAAPIAGLAAAAALLAGLAWILFHEPTAPAPGAADADRAPKDDLDRLIGELRSPSSLRREIAGLALRAYGGPAAERLERAKAAPDLVSGCRGGSSKAPVRVLAPIDASRWTAALESPLKERHEEAAGVLADLGFAAEPPLWRLLDSPDTGVRERAAGLLRRLYSPGDPPAGDALEEKLKTTRISMELADASLTELLEFVHGATAINFAIDTKAVENPAKEAIHLNVRDLAVDNVLRLVLHPRNRTAVAAGEVVLISSPSRVRKTPRGPSWRDPAEARRLELLLDALASRDPGRHRKAADELAEMGETALGPLLEGYRLFDPDAAARCRAVRRRIAEKLGVWLVEEPSGADVQELTAEQKALLNRTIDLQPSGMGLEEILRGAEIPCELRAEYPWKPVFIAKGLRVAWFLRAATRPYGLDFRLGGPKVVIDTAEGVRRAVEK